MIDLEAVRALAERARADTSDGLTAREQLIPVALELAAALEAVGAPAGTRHEWGNRFEHPAHGSGDVEAGPESEGGGEALARRRMTYDWYTAVLRRTVAYGPWEEVPGAWARALVLPFAALGVREGRRVFVVVQLRGWRRRLGAAGAYGGLPPGHVRLGRDGPGTRGPSALAARRGGSRRDRRHGQAAARRNALGRRRCRGAVRAA